jgi:hypothetical protein
VVVVQRSNRFTVYRGRTAYHVIDHGGIVARYGRESQDHPVTPGDQLVPLDAVLGVQGGRITVRRAALPSSSVPIDPPGGWPGFGDD